MKPVDTLAEFNRRALQAVGLEEAERALDNPDAATTSASKKNDSGSSQKDNSKRKNDNSQGDGEKRKKRTSTSLCIISIPSLISLGSTSF